ncbi:hypothetical protein BGW41_006423, partial [Actinomortierella wolfii]
MNRSELTSILQNTRLGVSRASPTSSTAARCTTNGPLSSVPDHENDPNQVPDQESGQESRRNSDDEGDKTHISIMLDDTQDEGDTEQLSRSQPTISISALPARNLLPQSLTNNNTRNTSPPTYLHMEMIQREYTRTANLLERVEKRYLQLSDEVSASPQEMQRLWVRSQQLRQYLAGLVQTAYVAYPDPGWDRYVDAMHTYSITARSRYQPLQDFISSATI